MNLYQLNQFKVIAECNNMTRAAELLGMTQPALSVSIKKLEAEFEVKLFDRSKQRITLNKAGEMALYYAEKILGCADEMTAAMKALSVPGTVVKIGFADSMPMWYFLSKSYEIRETKIRAEIYDCTLACEERLYNQVYDIILSTEKTDRNDMCSEYLFDDHDLLTVPSTHPLYHQDISSLSLREAGLERVAIYRVNNARYQHRKDFYASLTPTRFEFCDSFPLLVQVATHENIPTITAKTSLSSHTEAIGRRILPVTDPESSAKYYLSYPKKNRARLKPVIDFFKRNSACIEEEIDARLRSGP